MTAFTLAAREIRELLDLTKGSVQIVLVITV